MPTSLRKVRSFAHLVRYLEDELGWPLEGYGMSEITFEYDPEELGLKKSEAAKIRVPIRQLRPLTSGQPWGIFFIEFDRTRIPIAVLRRILSHLVIKKRASANRVDAAAWAAEDLLFISAFGGDADASRGINFAHFHQEKGDLPTLRVLGWDGNDTNLKVEHLDSALRDKLRWPDKTEGIEAWRKRWSGAFKHRVGHVINTADLLAEELAALARRIRDAATALIARESENGRLKKLHAAFKTHLIHDLTEEGFADTYAQTIAYGLLTAAISQQSRKGDGATGGLVAEDMTDMVPVTNPFLKEMLETFLHVGGRKGSIDFDELGVQDVVELLRSKETDLPAVIRDFGNKTQGEDPVIHFYEHFLAAYDKAEKKKRGVFYTPQPVVSYIVRSVHELLQTEFGLKDGLADTTTWGEMVKRNPSLKLPPLTDEAGETRTISPNEPFVQILDPATGTATFLIEVIDAIYRTLCERWKNERLTVMQQRAAWNEYVPKHLLPRLHAFELMMAPYAIAHMKIGLKLAETGYRFGTEERARIYLTNALEPKVKQLPQIGFDALAHEAAAVNEIKWYKRFTVVIGNPPYSGHSSNPARNADGSLTFAGQLLDRYFHFGGRPLGEKQPKWLHDDYVKFMRLAETNLSRSGSGVLGFITNHGFIQNPTFRGMRESLLSTFVQLWALDLEGSVKKGGRGIQGVDENVFDIEQGTAISVGVLGSHREARSLCHASMRGSRENKYRALAVETIHSTAFCKVEPRGPFLLLTPSETNLDAEWYGFPSLTEAMPVSALGIVSGRDDFAIDMDRAMLAERLDYFCNPKNSDAAVAERFTIRDAGGYILSKRRKSVLGQPSKSFIRPINYRPFDTRFVAYSRGFLTADQRNVMRHLGTPASIAFATTRTVETGEFSHLFCTRAMMGHHFVSLKESNYAFPLYLQPDNDPDSLAFRSSAEPNISSQFIQRLANAISTVKRPTSNLPAGLTPEDIFHYAYALFHSPSYRSRYAEFLKIDFPRLPLTGNLELFRALVRLGGELTAMHLLESPKLYRPVAEYVGGRVPEVEKVSWSANTVWLDKDQTTGFKGVREEVWNFHIGGYQVCEKWLKDRKGRTLTKDDLAHYQKIVVALSETIRLMKEVDAVIEKHGGWPGAFVTTGAAAATDTASTNNEQPSDGLDVGGELPLG